jgi:hypothetical protein
MTGNSLQMQWPLTSQLHGSVSLREQLVPLCYCLFLSIFSKNTVSPNFGLLFVNKEVEYKFSQKWVGLGTF